MSIFASIQLRQADESVAEAVAGGEGELEVLAVGGRGVHLLRVLLRGGGEAPAGRLGALPEARAAEHPQGQRHQRVLPGLRDRDGGHHQQRAHLLRPHLALQGVRARLPQLPQERHPLRPAQLRGVRHLRPGRTDAGGDRAGRDQPRDAGQAAAGEGAEPAADKHVREGVHAAGGEPDQPAHGHHPRPQQRGEGAHRPHLQLHREGREVHLQERGEVLGVQADPERDPQAQLRRHHLQTHIHLTSYYHTLLLLPHPRFTTIRSRSSWYFQMSYQMPLVVQLAMRTVASQGMFSNISWICSQNPRAIASSASSITTSFIQSHLKALLFIASSILPGVPTAIWMFSCRRALWSQRGEVPPVISLTLYWECSVSSVIGLRVRCATSRQGQRQMTWHFWMLQSMICRRDMTAPIVFPVPAEAIKRASFLCRMDQIS